METDDVALVTFGTVVWALALAVALVLRGRLEDAGRADWVWVLAAGVFIGLVGVRHTRRRRSRRMTG